MAVAAEAGRDGSRQEQLLVQSALLQEGRKAHTFPRTKK